MKRGKKIALIALMAIVALAGTIGGVAMAQSEEEETNPSETTCEFMERVCEIYQGKTGVAIDPQQLKDAFCQAGDEKMEQVGKQFRQGLIDEGIFTEEQLAEMEEWLQSKPDVLTEEFQEWLDSKPDNIPHQFGFGIEQGKRTAYGFGYAMGKGFGQGFGGCCQQDIGAE